MSFLEYLMEPGFLGFTKLSLLWFLLIFVAINKEK